MNLAKPKKPLNKGKKVISHPTIFPSFTVCLLACLFGRMFLCRVVSVFVSVSCLVLVQVESF